MNIFKKYPLPFLFLAIFAVVYLYFFRWQTMVVNGDDLYVFKDHYSTKSLWAQINQPITIEKYRPINGLAYNLLIDVFKTNLSGYYAFNTFVLAINTFILAIILNYFLKSYFFAFLFSLTFGLSNFFYYYICQLTIGGALEGLALGFFLLSLYFIVRAINDITRTPSGKFKDILYSILFANLALYTHERYIVVFVFIMAVVLILPSLRTINLKNRAAVFAFALMSIFLNVFMKKVVYSMPFFAGTGGTNIDFSFSQAFSFLGEALLSLCQINTGPEYLTGIKFDALPYFDKFLALIVGSVILVCLYVYLKKGSISLIRYIASTVVVQSALKKGQDHPEITRVFFLSILFVLCIAPAIVTIRLEQRWLTSSLAVFILMVVIILTSLNYKTNTIKYSLFSILIFCLLWLNHSYLSRGFQNIYMYSSENTAGSFKKAIENGLIRKQVSTLYFWEKHKDVNVENGTKWTLCDGYFFEFYGWQKKQIIFVDSIYTKTDTGYVTSFPNFDTATAQIIQFESELKDLTSEYMKDSLKAYIAKLKS